MIVVAIIAVLAVVVIPQFVKESTRAGAKSEVHPMFAELGSREEQYKTENNSYIAAAACPATASSSGTDMTTATCATGTDWTALRVQSPQSTLKCSYAVHVGSGGTNPSTHGSWPTWVTAPTTAPATGWYFILATCPTNEYFTASWDGKLQSQDGK